MNLEFYSPSFIKYVIIIPTNFVPQIIVTKYELSFSHLICIAAFHGNDEKFLLVIFLLYKLGVYLTNNVCLDLVQARSQPSLRGGGVNRGCVRDPSDRDAA